MQFAQISFVILSLVLALSTAAHAHRQVFKDPVESPGFADDVDGQQTKAINQAGLSSALEEEDSAEKLAAAADGSASKEDTPAAAAVNLRPPASKKVLYAEVPPLFPDFNQQESANAEPKEGESSDEDDGQQQQQQQQQQLGGIRVKRCEQCARAIKKFGLNNRRG